ncbi:MAG: DUF3810 domain-containing protein [Ruminococcus sp.]|nr:DUF3810 domain-containing protein [Ruminococcus sp.]
MTGKRKFSAVAAMIVVTALMAVINLCSWISPALSDFYADKIFTRISGFFSSFTGLLPFSLGEVMIAAGVILVIAALPAFTALLIKKRRLAAKKLGKFYCMILVFILVTETLNCFVLYHTTEFSEKYHGAAGAEGFTSEQLVQLCERTIAAANYLAGETARDGQGEMIVPDDLRDEAEKCMNRLAEEYPALKGGCPLPKKIRFSVLMTQLDLQGIYFPFSLEANYNSELCPARVPCTVMHELSHLKGFIREDEACFIAFRACMSSDLSEVRYSGTLSAMNYLYNAVKENASPEEAARLRGMISPQVLADNRFVSEEFREAVEQKAVIPTKTVSAASDMAMETTLKLNGVSDGKKSYSRMVDLLLEYYYCIGAE